MSAFRHSVQTLGIPLCRRKQSFINDRLLSDALVDLDHGELVISRKLIRNFAAIEVIACELLQRLDYRRLQPVCRKHLHETHTLLRLGLQPVLISVGRQHNHHSFFVGWLVKLLHQGMLLRIDGQHGKAQNSFTFWRFPGRPQSCNTHRLSIDSRNSCGDSFATSPVWFINRICRNDAVLRSFPGIPEAWLLRGSLTACIKGVPYCLRIC